MKKLLFVIISWVLAFILMSIGYGFWEKTLIIRGNIEVVKVDSPDSPVVSDTDIEFQSNSFVFEEQGTTVTDVVY
ncbi:hypothetical protein [Phosphitispora sp. TUW77]|uniref:hypothetical protein n=1 Tax=Phosphitispora sp. TUW77 TaxID=3152361 RepID=UPI003AB25B94